MEENEAILVDLPTSVRGFCYHDDEGKAFVVVNSRLTREQNQRTWEHERRHIQRGEIFEPSYNEYGRDIDGTV